MKLKSYVNASAIFLLILLVVLSGFTFYKYEDDSKKEIKATEQQKLRHVVLFKFKEGTTSDDIKKVEDAFRALPDKIPQIRDFEWGTNNSPEGLDKGFTHCFFLTFDSDADRAIYLPHPDHKAFGKILGPFLEDVLVVDYWIKE